MMRTRLAMVAQMLLGLTLVAMVAQGILAWLASERAARIPPGRTILRPPHDVNCLAVIGGVIWAGGKEGVFRFTPDGNPMAVPEELKDLRFVTAMIVDQDRVTWIAHEDGVTHWNPTATLHDSTQAGDFPGRGLALLRDRAGTLWAGSDAGLVKQVDGRFRLVTVPDAMALPQVDVLFEDRDGVLWIGDASPRSPGLLRLDGQGFRLLTRKDGLTHPAVNIIIQQNATYKLLIGTGFASAGGAVVIDRGQWRQVGRRQGLAGDKVRSLFEDGRGRLWIGSEYDGVAVFGPHRLAVIDEDGGLAGPEVKAMVEFPADTFWLGTNGGLTRITQWHPVEGDPRYPGYGRETLF